MLAADVLRGIGAQEQNRLRDILGRTQPPQRNRIAAPGTTFRMPGLRFGLVLGTRRVAHRIGAEAARDILQSSRTFDSESAQKLGFITRIAAQSEWPALMEAARETSAALTQPARARLHEQTVIDTRDADMAALAQSASVPGLKERIRIFREAKT